MMDNNLPVMANSKVNNHCSILISIDLYILGVTKRRKYEIKTIHRAYDYLFGFRNESTTPSGCSIPSVLNNKFSHSFNSLQLSFGSSSKTSPNLILLWHRKFNSLISKYITEDMKCVQKTCGLIYIGMVRCDGGEKKDTK